MVADDKARVQFLGSPWLREAAGGHNLVPLSQNRRLRAHTAGVCFASRTGRPPPLASEATLGGEREANPGRYRPLTAFDRGKGKAAGSLYGRRLCCVPRFQQVFLIEKLSPHPTTLNDGLYMRRAMHRCGSASTAVARTRVADCYQARQSSA